MKDRLRQIRESAGLSRKDFAARFNLSISSVESYECGRRVPSQAQIEVICREMNIDRNWLMTGEGTPEIYLDRNEQISKFVGDVLTDIPSAFRKRFVSMLSAMTPEEWALLEQMAKRLIDEKEE